MARNKKKRDQKIKRLKKMHIAPYIVGFVLFTFFFSITTSLLLGMFISYMVDNSLQSYEREAEAFVKEFEELNPDLLATGEVVVPDSAKPGSFLVFDKQGNCLYGDAEAPSENMYSYESDTIDMGAPDMMIEGYYIEMDLDVLASGNIMSSDNILNGDLYKKLIVDFIEKNLHSAVTQEWDKAEAVRLKAWKASPINNNKITVYYNTPIVFTNRDIASLLAMIAIITLASLIPMIMFLISLISGIVGQARSRRILYYDTMTDGNNWLWFQTNGPRALRRANRRKWKPVVVNIHMDKYQAFCLFNGAEEGEDLLVRIYRTIKRNLKKYEIFARNMEADFGLVLYAENPDVCNARLNEMLNQLQLCGYGQKISFSVGICEAEVGDLDIDQLYSNASVSRKSIASDAKERISWFNEQFKSDQLWEHKVEQTMDKALENGEFQVYLQPKYNAVTHELGGAEALIRWISPTEGFIGPGRFIPIFEKNGFITKIDDFMIRSVATLQAKWAAEGKNVVPVSVNVSRVHFTQEDLADHIEQLIAETGVERNLIELELTESAFFEDKSMLINTVEALKNKGFAISMDDFGAGYSSLNSLKELPIDVLKLDAEFFRGKEKNGEKGEVIVQEAIRLAKSLGMRTVAEGIEVAEQVEFLANNGCDLIQGFYFAKPMPIADYEARMEMKFPPEE